MWVRVAGVAYRFGRCERGQALPEYALVLALLAIGAMAAFSGVGTAANTQINSTATGLTNIGLSP